MTSWYTVDLSKSRLENRRWEKVNIAAPEFGENGIPVLRKKNMG